MILGFTHVCGREKGSITGSTTLSMWKVQTMQMLQHPFPPQNGKGKTDHLSLKENQDGVEGWEQLS